MIDRNDPILKYVPLWKSWNIDKLVGQGSYGRVYRISREDIGGKYVSAVKLIQIPRSAEDVRDSLDSGVDEGSLVSHYEGIAERTVQEIKALYELKGNPNIVAYEDHEVYHEEGSQNWDVLIRMEYLASLDDYLLEHQPLPEDTIRRLGIEICQALIACESKHILHRDIKEQNIFVSRDGTFKLGDFGFAKSITDTTATMSMRGTPGYLAPEVYRGEQYDARADIYSLGILLYKLLNTNRFPFLPPAPEVITMDDEDTAFQRRMGGEAIPLPANGSGALQEAIRIACSFHPEDRFQSAAAFMNALETSGGTVLLDDGPTLPVRLDPWPGPVGPEAPDEKERKRLERERQQAEKRNERRKKSAEQWEDVKYFCAEAGRQIKDKLRRVDLSRDGMKRFIYRFKNTMPVKEKIAYIGAAALAIGLIVFLCSIGSVSRISLNRSTLTMEMGDRFNLQAEVSHFLQKRKTNEVTWIIEDENLAKINPDGQIEALSEGKTTVMAKAVIRKKSCDLNIEQPSVAIGTARIKINATQADLSGQKIDDLTPIAGISTLESLNISGTQVKDLSKVNRRVQVSMDSPEPLKRVIGFATTSTCRAEDFSINVGNRSIQWSSSNPDRIACTAEGEISSSPIQYALDDQPYTAVITGKVENSNLKLTYNYSMDVVTPHAEFKEQQPTEFQSMGYFYPQLYSPMISQCYGFTLTISCDVKEGDPLAVNQRIWMRRDPYAWKPLATIALEDGKEQVLDFRFETPVNIVALELIPQRGIVEKWNYTRHMRISNLIFTREVSTMLTSDNTNLVIIR